MYNMNDILAQLQSGQSAEEIAKSFTDALNAAIQKQNEADARRKAKISDMANLIDDIIDFISKYYPEVLPEDADLDISEDAITELIDELDTAIPQLLKDLEKLTAKPISKAEPIDTAKKRSGVKSVTFEANDFSFDDAIEKFFRQNGLK